MGISAVKGERRKHFGLSARPRSESRSKRGGQDGTGEAGSCASGQARPNGVDG